MVIPKTETLLSLMWDLATDAHWVDAAAPVHADTN